MFKEEENEEDLGGQGTLCHAVISWDGKFIITAKDAYKTMENIRQEEAIKLLSLTVMSEAGRTHQALLFLPPSTSLLDTINFSTGPQIRPVSPKGIRATTSGSDQIFNTSLRGDKIHVLLVACQSGVNYPKSAINQLVLYYAQPASLNTSTAALPSSHSEYVYFLLSTHNGRRTWTLTLGMRE